MIVNPAKRKKKIEEMALNSDSSSLHYLALQHRHAGLSFEDFLLYFSNKDVGKLDLAISETILRDAFHQRLGSFYNHHAITCIGEFTMISNRKVLLERCEAPEVSIGDNYLLFLLLF